MLRLLFRHKLLLKLVRVRKLAMAVSVQVVVLLFEFVADGAADGLLLRVGQLGALWADAAWLHLMLGLRAFLQI